MGAAAVRDRGGRSGRDDAVAHTDTPRHDQPGNRGASGQQPLVAAAPVPHTRHPGLRRRQRQLGIQLRGTEDLHRVVRRSRPWSFGGRCIRRDCGRRSRVRRGRSRSRTVGRSLRNRARSACGCADLWRPASPGDLPTHAHATAPWIAGRRPRRRDRHDLAASAGVHAHPAGERRHRGGDLWRAGSPAPAHARSREPLEARSARVSLSCSPRFSRSAAPTQRPLARRRPSCGAPSTSATPRSDCSSRRPTSPRPWRACPSAYWRIASIARGRWAPQSSSGAEQ
jgi:hypothetical protein